MAWDDVLAAVGGGLSGFENQRRYNQAADLSQEKVDMAAKVAELRSMISGLQISAANDRAANAEAGRNSRNSDNNASRSTIAGQAEAGRNSRNTENNTARANIADQADSRYWDAAGRAWSLGSMRDDTTRRGQDISATTARRGQDIGATTAGANRDATAEARGEEYALNAYKADLANKRAQAGSIFQNPATAEPSYEDWLRTTADPEVFPSVRRAHGIPDPNGADAMYQANQRAADAPAVAPPAAPAVAPPAAAPAVMPPPRPTTRSAPPVPGRPGAAPAVPLETQARTLIDQIKAADAQGQDSRPLRAQLATLRAQAK